MPRPPQHRTDSPTNRNIWDLKIANTCNPIPDIGQQRVRGKQDLTFLQKELKWKLVSVIGNIYDISLVLYINVRYIFIEHLKHKFILS